MVRDALNWLIQNRKSQASDILKCKAEILEEFEWNILEVLKKAFTKTKQTETSAYLDTPYRYSNPIKSAQ